MGVGGVQQSKNRIDCAPALPSSGFFSLPEIFCQVVLGCRAAIVGPQPFAVHWLDRPSTSGQGIKKPAP